MLLSQYNSPILESCAQNIRAVGSLQGGGLLRQMKVDCIINRDASPIRVNGLLDLLQKRRSRRFRYGTVIRIGEQQANVILRAELPGIIEYPCFDMLKAVVEQDIVPPAVYFFPRPILRLWFWKKRAVDFLNFCM